MLTPAKVGLVVAGGIEEVSVFRRPVVGLLATGNEVMLPGKRPETGKLFASNLALQDAWLRLWSMTTRVRQAGDSFEDLTSAVESMLSECDVLLTSGGAWKGDRDLIVKVLDKLGWDLIFHRVRLGPGKAVAMGFLRGKPIFCLPGGPPSNEAAFLLIAFPAITRMAGYRGLPYSRLTGVLEKDVRGQKDWTQVIHCRVERLGLLNSSDSARWKKTPQLYGERRRFATDSGGSRSHTGRHGRTIHLPRGRTDEALTNMAIPHGIVLTPPDRSGNK